MNPKVIRTIQELRQEIGHYRSLGKDNPSVGFVPTMGYLHAGHASLLKRSAAENGLTVLSIFVNPLQFGPQEDLDKYPRDEERDLKVAAEAGVDLVFIPGVKEMYPQNNVTVVRMEQLTDILCGASRPGHFDGVATVVTKLFNIVQPNRAYFGLKDAQQIAVITRMVQDLNIPIEIIPCPIEREKDGLALSSRNVYLSAQEREQALVLSRALAQVPGWIRAGLSARRLRVRITEEITTQPLAAIDYVSVYGYPNLQQLKDQIPLTEYKESIIVALAVRFGQTRLIDNIILNSFEAGEQACSDK